MSVAVAIPKKLCFRKEVKMEYPVLKALKGEVDGMKDGIMGHRASQANFRERINQHENEIKRLNDVIQGFEEAIELLEAKYAKNEALKAEQEKIKQESEEDDYF